VGFEEEARCGRSSDPRRGRAPQGVRPAVTPRIVRESESALAAVGPHDGARDTLGLPSVNAQASSVFRAQVSPQHAPAFVVRVRVLDGAGGRRAQRWQIPSHRRRMPLPPWSPPRNPVEHLGDQGRQKGVANRVFHPMNALAEQRVAALPSWEADPQRVASLTGFDGIRSIPLNAN
jgi:hypothetical protein